MAPGLNSMRLGGGGKKDLTLALENVLNSRLLDGSTVHGPGEMSKYVTNY